MATLSHIDSAGNAAMVDVSGKAVTARTACAAGSVLMQPETLKLALEAGARKGDVLAAARIAGIMAAKRTHELIPLCHPLMVSKVAVNFETNDSPARIDVTASVNLDAKTGAEMEALTAVCVACLTIYDMLKAVDRAMCITDVRVTEKSGGKSGRFTQE